MITVESQAASKAFGLTPFLAPDIWRNHGRFRTGVVATGDGDGEGEVAHALGEIERSEGVVICLAASTANPPIVKGRERVDFVFVRHPESYVSITSAASGTRLAVDLDRWALRGWDLRDALMLFSHSSPDPAGRTD